LPLVTNNQTERSKVKICHRSQTLLVKDWHQPDRTRIVKNGKYLRGDHHCGLLLCKHVSDETYSSNNWRSSFSQWGDVFSSLSICTPSALILSFDSTGEPLTLTSTFGRSLTWDESILHQIVNISLQDHFQIHLNVLFLWMYLCDQETCFFCLLWKSWSCWEEKKRKISLLLHCLLIYLPALSKSTWNGKKRNGIFLHSKNFVLAKYLTKNFSKIICGAFFSNSIVNIWSEELFYVWLQSWYKNSYWKYFFCITYFHFHLQSFFYLWLLIFRFLFDNKY